MNNKTLQNQTIALAGICQAAGLIYDTAMLNNADPEALRISLHSIFQLDAPDIASVYENADQLKYGLHHLIAIFAPNKRSTVVNETTRYLMTMIQICKHTWRNADFNKKLKKNITAIQHKVNYYTLLDKSILQALASVYMDSFGKLKQRPVQIVGRKQFLTDELVMMQCRSLLLAGIRSAYLWRQLGGSIWQFLFWRKRYVACAEELLKPRVL